MKEALGIITGTIMISALVIVIIIHSIKIVRQGETSHTGIVLATKKGVFTDCVKISQTTIGESAIVKLCVYDDLDLPPLKTNVTIKYTHSPYLFMDRMKIEVSKK